MISVIGGQGGTGVVVGEGIRLGVYSNKEFVYITPSSLNLAIIPSTSATLPPPCRGGGSVSLSAVSLLCVGGRGGWVGGGSFPRSRLE